MFENNIWINAIAGDNIKNNSIYIYDTTTKVLNNIKNRDDLATNIFVLVDNVTEIIQKDDYVRCLRINISIA